MSNMLLVAALSALCLMTHWRHRRNLIHPGVVHGAIWLMVSLGYAGFQAELDIVSPTTIVILMSGIMVFSIGIYLGEQVRPPMLATFNPGPQHSRQLPLIITCVSIAGLVLLLAKAFEYQPTGLDNPLVWYKNLRSSAIEKGKGLFGLGGYALNFCYAGVVYLIIYRQRVRPTNLLWICVALAIAYAIFSTGRTYLVLLACLVVGTAMPRGRRVQAAIIFGTPLVITAITLLAGRFDTGTGNAFSASFSLHAKMYSIAPVGIFDYLVNSNLPSTLGSMTFRTPLAVLHALGLPVTVPELIQPWVNTRVPGNVFTVFSPYYRDFGLPGVAVFMLLLGSLHGWVFRQLHTGQPMIIIANALLFYALLMQFFMDQYFTLMSQWVQIIAWMYLFTKLQPLPSVSVSGGRAAQEI